MANAHHHKTKWFTFDTLWATSRRFNFANFSSIFDQRCPVRNRLRFFVSNRGISNRSTFYSIRSAKKWYPGTLTFHDMWDTFSIALKSVENNFYYRLGEISIFSYRIKKYIFLLFSIFSIFKNIFVKKFKVYNFFISRKHIRHFNFRTFINIFCTFLISHNVVYSIYSFIRRQLLSN